MSDTKSCPYCGELIKSVAIKCKHCGERLDNPSSAMVVPTPSAPTMAPGAPSAPAVLPGASSAPTAFSDAGAGGAFGLGEVVPGTKLGSYVISRLIGAGGMGSVYQAHHERLGNPVAIKVLAPNLARDPELIGRFEQEARLQANLRHPNIIAVTDFLVDAGLCAFVMEYAEGVTLREVIDRQGGPMSIERIKALLVPVVEALGHAHEHGIVHRDVKPSNIMVATVSGREVVKVTDFGIAKALGGHQRTAAGSQLGTLYYMSPEQCRESRDVDHRTDIYSLGVTLYEMATGAVPFNYESQYEMMTAHISEAPPEPRRRHPAVSPGLRQLILRAMAKDPSARFQSAAELLDALKRSDERTPAAPLLPTEVAAFADPTPAPPVQQAAPPPWMETARVPGSSETAYDERGSGSSKRLLLVIFGGGGLLVLLIIALAIALSGSSRDARHRSSSRPMARTLPRTKAERPHRPARPPRGSSRRSRHRDSPHSTPRPSHQPSGSARSNETVIDWWCMCFIDDAPEGGMLVGTACRKTLRQCRRLEKRFRGENHVHKRCIKVRAAHPGDVYEGRSAWTPSEFHGAWQVERSCVL